MAIHDYGGARNENAPAYIVMELVNGISLGELLRRERHLPPGRAIRLMRHICAGVGAAHRRNIFHRDLKPDNVIVLPPDEDRERETVKVMDFGIAKLRDAAGAPKLTQTGMFIGTPYYMSPEQCRGEALDARADVYSLGALLYKMFAGEPPFTAQSIAGVIAKHLTEAPLPEALGVPPALEALMTRALAKDPDARPADATELARELRAEEEAIRQREASAQLRRGEEQRRPTEGRGEPLKRTRGAVMIATTALVVGIVGVAGLLIRASLNEGASAGDQQQTVQQTSQTGDTPRSNDLRNLIEMVEIPAGSFMMGSTNGEDDEKPVHRVTIAKSFYMGKYEVTQAQWRAVMGNNPSHFKGDSLPVEMVSWNDAQGFIRRLNEMNDCFIYRLPSEAEWEYACRAGTTGDYAGDLDSLAWYGNNSGRQYLNAAEIWRTDSSNYGKRIMDNGSQTHPVGQKRANGFELYDMHGNVWEWCQDHWHEITARRWRTAQDG